MIAKSNNPLSPDTVITLHGVEVDYTSVVGFTLTLEEGKHDVCVIKVRGLHTKAVTDYIDAPVRVSISSGPGRRQEFCGYVLYVEPTSITRAGYVNNSPFQEANIVCFGASMVMKGAKSAVWENMSFATIAQIIADRYNFSIDVRKTDYVYPRLVQATESDWAFLNRMAHLHGLRVSLHGTHIHIWDATAAVGRRPFFMNLYSTRSNLDSVPGTITKFTGSFGYLSPEGVSTNYKVAVLDNQGNITSSSTKTLVDRTLSGETSLTKFEHLLAGTPQNIAEAEMQLKAKTREAFAFNAVVEVLAGAGAVPGGVVSITDYNSNFDGIWYVSAVQHEHMGSNYYTTLHVGRDFDANNTFKLQNIEAAGEPPTPVFVNTEWRSSNKRAVKYV